MIEPTPEDPTVTYILCDACGKQLGIGFDGGMMDLSTLPAPETVALFTETGLEEQ